MRIWVAFTALSLASSVLLACSSEAPGHEPTPTRRATFDFELETFHLPDLIYWEEMIYSAVNPPPGPYERLVVEMGESDDPRYEPYLVELALYPTPYREVAAQALFGNSNPTVGEVLEYIGGRGRKEPADDEPMFLAFKQRLMGSIFRTSSTS